MSTNTFDDKIIDENHTMVLKRLDENHYMVIIDRKKFEDENRGKPEKEPLTYNGKYLNYDQWSAVVSLQSKPAQKNWSTRLKERIVSFLG
jgi:hypothetical protein